ALLQFSKGHCGVLQDQTVESDGGVLDVGQDVNGAQPSLEGIGFGLEIVGGSGNAHEAHIELNGIEMKDLEVEPLASLELGQVLTLRELLFVLGSKARADLFLPRSRLMATV